MMKKVFYWFMGRYMDLISFFFFSKVEIRGKENIPVGNPIIYSCNHQNAFMDALLIGAYSPIKITSITRSDVFGNHAGMWFMDALQMVPIYRMRDGFDKLALNDEIFKKVRERLFRNEGVLIFSEGNHGNEYFLRPLSKGSSRMALESQEQMMDKDIYVVPIGINYFHHQRPLHKISVKFGEAIKVKDYFDSYKAHAAKGTNELKNIITIGMKKCLVLPEEDEKYKEKKLFINRNNENLPFEELQTKLAKGENLKSQSKLRRSIYLFGKFLGVFNFLPLLLIELVLKGIKDIVFYCSIKWFSSLFIFPIWWLGIFLIGTTIFGLKGGILALSLSIGLLFFRQYLIKLSNQPH